MRYTKRKNIRVRSERYHVGEKESGAQGRRRVLEKAERTDDKKRFQSGFF